MAAPYLIRDLFGHPHLFGEQRHAALLTDRFRTFQGTKELWYAYFRSGEFMPGRNRLTEAELADIRRRRPGVRSSLACEGLYLTAEEEALFEQMDRERL